MIRRLCDDELIELVSATASVSEIARRAILRDEIVTGNTLTPIPGLAGTGYVYTCRQNSHNP